MTAAARMRVVVAPDSFKGSMDAAAAASAIGSGWRAVRPFDELLLLPQADGGEGTLSVLATVLPGARLIEIGDVSGPDGRPTPGAWLQLPDGTAVVELALSSGLPLMRSLDPLGATTRGLGETIAAALDAGARSLVVGLGGSASTDGGAGALRALGLALFDADELPLPEGGAALARLARVDAARLRPAPPGGVRLLSDVSAPLLGPTGAAAVFGPQKGATPAQQQKLERALARWASCLHHVVVPSDSHTEPERSQYDTTPGAGAAGGTGFGFLAVWGAAIESGAAAIALLTGLGSAAASTDILITGEGRFDASSLTGKVTGHTLALPTTRTARKILIAGGLGDANLADGVRAISLTELAGSLDAARDDPDRWLFAAGIEAARAVADES